MKRSHLTTSRMRADGQCVVLVAAILSIGALAYASPVDPTWITGVYDDGDYDDVVTMVSDAMAAPATDAVVSHELQLIGYAWIEGRGRSSEQLRTRDANRGPPQSLLRLPAPASRSLPRQQFAPAAQRVALLSDSVRPTSHPIGTVPHRLIQTNVTNVRTP